MKSVKYIACFLLLIGAFFLGTAWKNSDAGEASKNDLITEAETNIDSKEEIVNEANESTGFKFTSDEKAVINLFEEGAPSKQIPPHGAFPVEQR